MQNEWELLEDIFDQFENDEVLLRFKFECDDVLMWPLIRWKVILILLKMHIDQFKPTENDASERKPNTLSMGQKMKYAWTLFLSRPRVKNADRDCSILWISTGKNSASKEVFNYSDDPMIKCFDEDEILVLDQLLNKSESISKWPKRTYSFDYLNLKAGGLAKLFGKVNDKDLVAITALIAVLREKMEIDKKSLVELQALLCGYSKKLPYLKKVWSTFFEKYPFKLMFLSCASYCTNAYLAKWAKERDIRVVELQHGVIFRRHLAYRL